MTTNFVSGRAASRRRERYFVTYLSDQLCVV